MSGTETSTAPEQELTQAKARANLLLALYANATHDLEQSKRECDDVRGELAQARGEIHRLSNDLGYVTARTTELQQRHASLLNSTSWRVTAPLRALGGLIKRGS